MKAAVLYLLTIVILTVYGTEVCPFIESLGLTRLTLNIAGFIVFGFLLRLLLLKFLLKNTPLENQSQKQLKIEIGIFLFLGISNTLFNVFQYGFPFGSGMKLFLGYLTLGLFTSVDLVLEKERKIISFIRTHGRSKISIKGFLSLPRKFAIITVVAIVFIIGIIFLLILKDFKWLESNLKPMGLKFTQMSIMKEVIFVLGIIALFAINLIISYSKNLRVYFNNQIDILKRVSNDDLEGYVPVISNDEFGMIADHTNSMIDGLREKRKIKKVFGKVVNPLIVEKILKESDGQNIRQGKRQRLVILFSDIRNFTTMTESQAPELIVKELNAYFSLMVPVIREQGGIVDKFIGDGLLAFFGLDESEDPVNQAVKAAVDMHKSLEKLNQTSSLKFRIGVGIHCGDVIAGIIGSQDRLEFTVIGDIVNTASRLETLTKKLNAKLTISSAVKETLNENLASLPWTDFGEQQLKGKIQSIQVFGLEN